MGEEQQGCKRRLPHTVCPGWPAAGCCASTSNCKDSEEEYEMSRGVKLAEYVNSSHVLGCQHVVFSLHRSSPLPTLYSDSGSNRNREIIVVYRVDGHSLEQSRGSEEGQH